MGICFSMLLISITSKPKNIMAMFINKETMCIHSVANHRTFVASCLRLMHAVLPITTEPMDFHEKNGLRVL